MEKDQINIINDLIKLDAVCNFYTLINLSKLCLTNKLVKYPK